MITATNHMNGITLTVNNCINNKSLECVDQDKI